MPISSLVLLVVTLNVLAVPEVGGVTTLLPATAAGALLGWLLEIREALVGGGG